MKRAIPVLMLIALLGGSLTTSSAWADSHDGGRSGPAWGTQKGHGYHDSHWNSGWHGGGHIGWLWAALSALMIYDAARNAPVVQPPAVIVQTPASTPAAPATAYWYFCPASGAYYPYVQTCPGGWRTVPATPPPSN
jgi:hypothetical protein